MKEQRKGYNPEGAAKEQKTLRIQSVLQYRGSFSNESVKKLKTVYSLQTIFTTWKLKSCLPILLCSFHKNLKFQIIYEITFNGCKSIYVRQTSRHNATRVAEHARVDSTWGNAILSARVIKTALQ